MSLSLLVDHSYSLQTAEKTNARFHAKALHLHFTFYALADAFIQATYIAFKLQLLAFPGNRTHDLDVC